MALRETLKNENRLLHLLFFSPQIRNDPIDIHRSIIAQDVGDLRQVAKPPMSSAACVALNLSTHLSATTQRSYTECMSTARYLHWQDRGMWLGYFEDFPDYLTQGKTLGELQENL